MKIRHVHLLEARPADAVLYTAPCGFASHRYLLVGSWTLYPVNVTCVSCRRWLRGDHL